MADPAFDLNRCVERAQTGDQDAARLLVEHLYPEVLRLVRAHLPRRTADVDLAQDVFVKLLSRLHQYRPHPGIPFTHWVSRLAVRTCLDALRAERRRPEIRWSELSDDQTRWLDFLAAENQPAPTDQPAAARELVELLLRQLSPDDRLVLTLLDLQERSVREISAATGWSVPGVKVRAFRARRRLQRLAPTLR